MAPKQRRSAIRMFDPSFLLAGILTTAFYIGVSRPSMHGTLLYHYTTEHAVEYVIVAVFIWGIIDLAIKLISFPKEILALRQEWLPARQGREPASNAHKLLEKLRSRPSWLQDSRIGRRLIHALEHATEKSSPKEFREHVRYLANQDEDATHASYMLIRFVIGVTPVLGFLGTVIHFGTALSGISFEEMTEKLPVVVGEMGTAFNTTTVALIAAMTMMFSLFLCQRIDRGIVHAIDRLVEHELLTRFEFKDPSIVPFLSAVQSANDEALQSIRTTLERQIDVWVQALDSVFQRFDDRQDRETQTWQVALEALRQRHEQYDSAREERLRQTLDLVESRQDQHFVQIEGLLERALTIREDFGSFAKTLEGIARGEGKLVELQSSLADNLRVLRETQQIDEALHGLTAAIHLLTARHQPAATAKAA
jgi:biopolymer transport protein ExbB/TolQ